MFGTLSDHSTAIFARHLPHVHQLGWKLSEMSCTGCSTGADGKPTGCKSNGYCSTSGCNKLGVFDWLAGVPIPGGQQPFEGVEVRFKNTRKAFYRNTSGLQLMPGDLVMVDARPATTSAW